MKLKSQSVINSKGELSTEFNTTSGTQQSMVCEYSDCIETIGRDYKRRFRLLRRLLGDKWANEPIYLCNKHCKGRKPIL